MKKIVLTGSLTIALLFGSYAAAQENQEKDYEIAMTKGEFAIENGDYEAAIEHFVKAREVKPRDKNAALSLGIAYSRADEAPEAAEVLREALTIDPSDPRIRYELGVALYKQDDRTGAREQFAQVAEAGGDEALKAAAKDYLDRIAAQEGARRFSLDAQGGLQYDSNVIFDPVNPVAPLKEKKSDSRGVINLNGRYQIANSGAFNASAGYQFYQSLHFQLEDFNVQQHTLSLNGRSSVSGNAAVGLSYAFSYTGVGTKHYATVHQAQPVLDLRFSSDSLTRIHLAYAGRRYFNSGAFPGNSERNLKNSSAGVTHTLQVTKGTGVSADYTYDRDGDAVSDVWKSAGHKGSLKFQSDLGPVTAYGNASYTDRKYDKPASPLAPARHDQIQNYLVGLSRGISKTVRLNLNDDYTYNDSNLTLYRYKRNIIGLFVEIQL